MCNALQLLMCCCTLQKHPVYGQITRNICWCLLHFGTCSGAKASASSAVRVARNVVRDVGESAAASSGGLLELARCQEATAERDTHRLLVKKYHLSLPIPHSQLGKSSNLSLTILKLKDWLQFILDFNIWHAVVGLKSPNQIREAANLKEFWRRFETIEPQHPAFDLAKSGQICLERTCPLLVHGDEGRGRRRAPVLVTGYHSILGRGIRAAERIRARTGNTEPQRGYLKLQPNFRGHSFVTRYLQAIFPKAAYQDEQVF